MILFSKQLSVIVAALAPEEEVAAWLPVNIGDVHLQVGQAEQHALPGGSGASNIDLFRYGKCIINIDTKVAHRALDLGVAEQELYGS